MTKEIGPMMCQLDGCDDILDEIEETSQDDQVVGDVINNIEPKRESNEKMNTQTNVINTNARSLCPKIDSLIDCSDTTIAIITETWLADGKSLD